MTTNVVAAKLISMAEEMVAMATAIEPPTEGKPITFFGTEIRNDGSGWRTMLAQYEAERVALMALPAPFGRTPDSRPMGAPAYDELRSLWEAAQRAGKFDIFEFIPGIQPLYPVPGEPVPARPIHEHDLQLLQDKIVALGTSEWGKTYLANDVAAAGINPKYQAKFLGYTIKQVKDAQGNPHYERVPV